MLQYNAPCFKGTPSGAAGLEAIELENFAVQRDEDQRFSGLMVSDDELPSPVLKVFFDPDEYKIWLLPEVRGKIYFATTDVVPLDVLDTLGKTTGPIRLYVTTLTGSLASKGDTLETAHPNKDLLKQKGISFGMPARSGRCAPHASVASHAAGTRAAAMPRPAA